MGRVVMKPAFLLMFPLPAWRSYRVGRHRNPRGPSQNMGTARGGADPAFSVQGALAVEVSVWCVWVCVCLWPWKYTWGEGQ